MHRVVLLVVTLVLAYAGWVALPQVRAQEATPAASCPTTSKDENEAMARRWYEDAYNGADLSVLDEILSPDVRVPQRQSHARHRRHQGSHIRARADRLPRRSSTPSTR